jgi:NitT/TauT family transport system ATP-binding protein
MQGELIKIWSKLRKTVVFVTHSVIEAVYLSDIIVVLSARPGRVKGIFEASFPRPRDYTGSNFLKLRKEILGLLEEEVMKEISLDHL